MGILLVVKNEFVRSLKYKKKAVITMILPVIAVIAAVGINAIMKPSINIGIVEKKDTVERYERFKSSADRINGLNVEKTYEKSIYTDMIIGKYGAVIEFKDHGAVKVSCLDNTFKEKIEKIMKSYSGNGELRGFEEGLSSLEDNSMTPAQRGASFMLITLIITCTLSACNLIKDKEEGTVKRVIISPCKPKTYILGVFIYNLLHTVLQIIFAVIVIWMLPIEIGISMGQLTITGLTIAFISSGISSLIVNLCRSELQASILASVSAMIMVLLGGAFMPLDKMPVLLKGVSNITVTKWVIMFVGSMQNRAGNGAADIAIWIILGLSLLMIILSCNLGKRKFLSEI